MDISGFELAKRNSEKKAVAMIVDGQIVDLSTIVPETIALLTKQRI